MGFTRFSRTESILWQTIKYCNGEIEFDGLIFDPKELIFSPENNENNSFDLFNVTIGIKFHWERKEN